jgi:hypothetical protein
MTSGLVLSTGPVDNLLDKPVSEARIASPGAATGRIGEKIGNRLKGMRQSI